jgi:hypothetical protein
VVDAPHRPGATEASLHFVDDEDDAVLVAEAPHALQELRRRHDEPALALHGFDHDRGDGLGCDVGDQHPLEGFERDGRARPAVVIRERRAVDLRRERP